MKISEDYGGFVQIRGETMTMLDGGVAGARRFRKRAKSLASTFL